MKKRKPHSASLRLHRRTNGPGTFFFTKCLIPRRPVLNAPDIAANIIQPLAFSASKGRIELAAFVVMPSHWHALIGINPPWTLPKILHSIDTWIGRHTKKALEEHTVQWQDGYHDTLIRSTKQFHYMLNYIEGNPVEKGLVPVPREWEWSSANPGYSDLLTRPWPWVFPYDRDNEMVGVY